MTSSIYECLVDEYPINGSQIETCVKGLDLVGSRIDLAGAELELVNKENREIRIYCIKSENMVLLGSNK